MLVLEKLLKNDPDVDGFAGVWLFSAIIVSSSYLSFFISCLLVIYLPSHSSKNNPCKDQDDEEQHPGQRGCVAHVQELESGAVEIQHIEQGGILWTTVGD